MLNINAQLQMMAVQYFQYGETEINYLKSRDKRLGEVIDRVGMVERRVIPDLYAALVHSIVGQQISSKAHATIWRRMQETLSEITMDNIAAMSTEQVQQFGISFRKASYIKDIADKIAGGEFSLEQLYDLPDEEVCRRLCSLHGIGTWTAEMLMLFSMQRPNVLSFSDLAIIRGMKRVYHHRQISRALFERYRRRLSPYCSVASLYFWKVAGGQY